MKMIQACAAACLLLWSASAAAQSPEREFAESMLPRLHEAMPEAELEIDKDDPLVVKVSNWRDMDDAQVNLHRVFSFCQNNPADDCEQVAEDLVSGIFQEMPTEAKSDLRLIVRDQQYMDYVLQTFGEQSEKLTYKKIGEDLFAILAFDSPNTIALAHADRLEDLELDREAAWMLAQAQTTAILPELPDGKTLADSAMIYEQFEYLPSMMVDLEAWTKIAGDAGPDLFITAVASDFVFVGVLPDGPDFEGLKESVVEDCTAARRCITPNVYRFRDGQWAIAP